MIKDFKALKLTVASPQQVLSWSYGEVKKAETINYRTHRPEVDGLMDEKIFGPTKNFECYCGKYKKIRYKGIICDKCGVEVTHKRVRRERMGHIKMASPVAHVWYFHGVPNKLAIILGITQKKLETVIYFARYLVTKVDDAKKQEAVAAIKKQKEAELGVIQEELKGKLDEVEQKYKEEAAKLKKSLDDKKKLDFQLDKITNDEKKENAKVRSIYTQKENSVVAKYENIVTLAESLQVCSSLSEEDLNLLREYKADFFTTGMGAEALKDVLAQMSVEKELADMQEEAKKTKSLPKQKKIMQRLRVMEGMRRAGISPSWLVLDVLPVIPPDLRPIIQLPGGRFATSDLNDLYRRVINRNNRLKRLINLGAPEIILRNEKRMAQEAVDALIDNEHRPGNPVQNSRGLPYKSLSDMLRGKQGRFRQNLLGKRVDYSGRAVIVSGPDLKINQCGLPKTMALELFKPFVLREIIVQGLAPNIKSAKLFFESKAPEVWDILEKVIENRPVLLNRAPTLHKQGIQAFYPTLVEGNAIRLHPMVCKGFNADFDGDQMAVHVPLSEKAVEEAKLKMFPTANVLLMADGNPVINVEKDMALGVYFLTGMAEVEKPRMFASKDDALRRFDLNELDLREKIKVLFEGRLMETTMGRLIFNEALPKGFSFINKQLNKGDVAKLSAKILQEYGAEEAIEFLNNVEALGFKFATISALNVGMEDFVVSPKKDQMLKAIEKQEDQLTEDYYNGLLTQSERQKLMEKIWMDLIEKVAEDTWNTYVAQGNNNLVTLQESGAVPVQNPLRQISGIRGLILDPLGHIVPLPLRSNYKEGLSPLEYFVAARGTRKGLADTALKTAESGYLTRRLVDVAQDVIIRDFDCGATEGIPVKRETNRRISFEERMVGRFTMEDIADPESGEVLTKKGEEITVDAGKKIADSTINEVLVRSVLKCRLHFGVCQKCYGYNLGTKKLVEKGIAVGVIAAQSMGEAATQLTLNTKHLAGRAGTDITQGLPRVEELFEVRTPKAKAIIAGIDGTVKLVMGEDKKPAAIKVSNNKKVEKIWLLEKGDELLTKKSGKVEKDMPIYKTKGGEVVNAIFAGTLKIDAKKAVLTSSRKMEEEYPLTPKDILVVEDGANVITGAPLTLGSIDPKELMDVAKLTSAQLYLIDNIQETYGIQGISIDDKHVEVIIRQMSRYCKITETGDSSYLVGSMMDYIEFKQENEKLVAEGKQPAKGVRQLLGITLAAIKTESFLSASSFEQQVRVLSEAALNGKNDYLRGLKENVIIGRTVPLGDELR